MYLRLFKCPLTLHMQSFTLKSILVVLRLISLLIDLGSLKNLTNAIERAGGWHFHELKGTPYVTI